MPRTSAAPRKKKTVRAASATARKPAARRVRKPKAAEAPAAAGMISHGHAVHVPEHREVRIRPADARNRRLAMWLSVSVIMTAIVIAWIMNLTSVLGPDVKASAEPTRSDIDFERFKQELDQTMQDVKDNLRDLQEISEEPVTPTAQPDASASAFEKFRQELERATPTATPNTLPN